MKAMFGHGLMMIKLEPLGASILAIYNFDMVFEQFEFGLDLHFQT